MSSTASFYQFLVAGSAVLVALPVGCSVAYPSVLIHQLSSNGSSIELDWDTSSWIGSIHGLAGIPSIMMPALMQWKGRKLAFIAACLISILGWIISYTATSSNAILISECIHGFGSHSILAVSMLGMSEMLSPRIRHLCLGMYLVVQALGVSLVQILGSYLHWRTVSLVICVPLIVTTLAACKWPESPSWLAYKGYFEECTQSFLLLRGSYDIAKVELEELILAQKENLMRSVRENKSLLRNFWVTLRSRDFYLPGMHIFVLFYALYWNGCMVIMIYTSEIILKLTLNTDAAFYGSIVINSTWFIYCSISIVLMKYFRPKIVFLVNILCGTVFSLSISIVQYLQSVGLVSPESFASFILLIGYVISISIIVPIVLTIASELMPVKHRGVGGPLYVTITCVLHTTSLKLAPYLFIYIQLWGLFLLYSVNTFVCGLLVWKFIPETKGRTLQQLEDYYTYGHFERHRRQDSNVYELKPLNNLHFFQFI